MKVSYYKIYSKNFIENVVSEINIRNQIERIISEQQSNSSEFISHVMGDVYIFIKLNNHDLIKKINKQNLSVEEIQSILNNDEAIGFSSYFIVKGNVIGYGPTLLSAKINRLSEYINKKLDTTPYNEIIFEPICKHVTQADALNLQFIGKTTFRVEANTQLGAGIRTFLGLNNIDEELLNNIEITIKPMRGKNIKKCTKQLIREHFNEMEMLKVMAREEMADQAVELYVADNIMCDFIDHKRASQIPFELEICYENSNDAIMRQLENTV